METPTTQQRIYTLFGKPVQPGTLLYKLCEKYYGDFLKLEKDLEASNKIKTKGKVCLMLDIREAFWCNEFRTEDLELRRKVLYENYYCSTDELMPI